MAIDVNLPCEPPSKRVIERLDEPIEGGQCCVHEGRPCIVFEDWDYAEDWSGEFVQVLRPPDLLNASRVSTQEFWARVREAHGVAGG